MDVFNQRISIEETATIVRAVRRHHGLGQSASVIIHHMDLMRARLAALQAAFPEGTLHAVAIKANPLLEILREIVRRGCGLEAASIEEVQLALAADCPAEHIVFDSPAKTPEEIEQALCWGVHLNVDNFDELERVAAVRSLVESKSVVGLRINTMVGSGTIRHTSVSKTGSKFGVSWMCDRPQVIAAFDRYSWLSGLHTHVGSQGCDLQLLVEAASRISILRQAIMEETGREVPYIDLGGGLPTSYCTGTTAPTPAQYRSLLDKQVPALFAPEVSLITEFGRAVHANCGIAASRVEYVKPSQCLAVIHLGADFLLRRVYCPQDWLHEIFVLDRRGFPKTGKPTPITIVGPLCFAGDIVASDILLPPIEEGDWIVIRDVGAYTLSMWSRHCSRAIPPVLGYDPHLTEKLRVLRHGETANDVVRFWS